jgi:peptidoglycan hydrolase-like protein with peptidoglycan-binding domain
VRFRVLLAVAVAAGVFASPAGAYSNAQHAGVQVALRALGLYHGPIDGLVGPQTVAAIKAAQRRAHLPVTGLADKRTRHSLGPLGRPLLGKRILHPGLFGLDVAVLQFLLTKEGVYDGPLDGYLSVGTDSALRRYQRSVHLPADGVVGPRTLAAFVLENKVSVRPQAVSTSRTYRLYVVRPGDSLTAIAHRFGVSLGALARANHLDPSHVLLIGKKLKIPGGGGTRTSSALAATPTEVRERLDYWAGKLGVSPHLLRALAWMESGFQPNVVSKAGARGVLQTLPVTRDFVEDVLVGHRLPNSLDGDIQTGVLYLRHLLQRFDANEHLALAAWYQGEAAVRKHGVLPVTKPFVAGVLALKQRM